MDEEEDGRARREVVRARRQERRLCQDGTPPKIDDAVEHVAFPGAPPTEGHVRRVADGAGHQPRRTQRLRRPGVRRATWSGALHRANLHGLEPPHVTATWSGRFS